MATYSPKELEGEVDHSFFDSDCEVGVAEVGRAIHEGPEEGMDGPRGKAIQSENPQRERRAEEGGRTEVTDERGQSEEEEVFEAEKGVRRLEEDFSGLQVRKDGAEGAGNRDGEWGEDGRTERGDEESREQRDRPDLRSERGEDRFESRVPEQRREAESGREDSDASSRKSSPLPLSDRSESRRSSQSDDSSSVRSYSSVEPRSEDDDDDDVVIRDEERPPEPQPPEHSLQLSINPVPNKFAGKFRTRSRLSSSEHESSCSSDDQSPTFRSVTPVTPSPPQPPRQGSTNHRDGSTGSEESEDTVTDVTPLSTPDASPKPSFDLSPRKEPPATVASRRTQDAGQRDSSDPDGVERSGALGSGRRVDSVLVASSPAGSSSCSTSGRGRRRRKNYSFTNEEVRRIERENQRLLRELSRTPQRASPCPRSTGSAPSPTHAAGGRRPMGPPTLRLYHTALNRQREQQRIQRDNLSFLKRLESVKATPGMTRSEQLADYQRQAGYLGIPTSLMRPASGRGSRSCSVNQNRTRPETAKPSRTPPPRPAWN
ncbi:cilia- and flagella-associated protein 97 [Brachyhypopomus gauderio]|uniref:cilia- and flagella-associated protein 97 n=1 Tax=Brachyhypopomus gauderio TaxID=698409 RepID=UPI004043054F